MTLSGLGKFNWVAIAVLAVAAVPFAAKRELTPTPANLTASWNYNYVPQPPCADAQASNCIDHFEVEDITDSEKSVLIKTVSNPTSSGSNAKVQTSFTYGPPFGIRTISVIAVARDHGGKRVTSNPYAARVTVNVQPHAKLSLPF